MAASAPVLLFLVVLHSFDISRYHFLWRCGVVVITTAAQLHLTKPELRFCAGSNAAYGMSEIRNGEDL